MKIFQGHEASSIIAHDSGPPIAIGWLSCSLVEEALMLKRKALRLQIAGAAALAMLFGTSAFAESRHLNGTRGGSSGHSFSHGSGFSRPSFGRSGGGAPRFESRNFGSR